MSSFSGHSCAKILYAPRISDDITIVIPRCPRLSQSIPSSRPRPTEILRRRSHVL